MNRSNRWTYFPPLACFALALALLGLGCGSKKYTIEVTTDPDCNKNPVPRECMMSRSHADKVRWHNMSGKDLALEFDNGWPFKEPQEDKVPIKAGDYSSYYTLNKSLSVPANHKFTYKDPALPSCGPGEPAIVDGP